MNIHRIYESVNKNLLIKKFIATYHMKNVYEKKLKSNNLSNGGMVFYENGHSKC
jgi:hypothetical protein